MRQSKVIRPWRNDRNPELAGYTGHLFEWEVLGECKVRASGYLRFRAAVEEVLSNQPHAPHNPPGEIGTFRRAVAVGISERGVDPDQLRLYTAVCSTLDIYHHIEGFFFFEGVIVTMDTTINPNKDQESCRARILVTGEDAINGYKDVAVEIARCFERARNFDWKGVV